MKIELSKKQYRALLDLIFAGEWMVNGTRTSEEVHPDYEDVLQHIYSYAESFGFENLIAFDKTRNLYYETKEHEAGDIERLMDEYDDVIFWSRLAFDLAERDALLEIESGSSPDEGDLFVRTLELEEEYLDEFEMNGLGNVVVERNRSAGSIPRPMH